MNAPLVSVIVPSYNHAPFLAARLDSVLGQTFKDIEVWVLDDCSPDDSRQVIARYAAQDSRIRTHFNETNSGNPFHQWNKGLALAQGEYVWIAESDDVAAPDFLETCLKVFRQQPKVGMVYTASHLIDQRGDIIGLTTDWYDNIDTQKWRQDHIVNGREECRTHMFVQNIVHNASAVLFQRSLAVEANASFRLAGDQVFWIGVMEQTDVAFVARPLNYFRKHVNNVTSKHFHGLGYLNEALRVMGDLINSHEVAPNIRHLAVRGLYRHWFRVAVHQPLWKIFSAEYQQYLEQFRQISPTAVPRREQIAGQWLAARGRAAVPRAIKDRLRQIRS